MVEHDLAKVGVAGSSPVSRSRGEKGDPDKYREVPPVPTDLSGFLALFLFKGGPDGGMVDTLDLKSNGHYGCGGSSPPPGTK